MDISNIISRIEETLMPIVPFIKQYWDTIILIGVLWTLISLPVLAFVFENAKEYKFGVVYTTFKTETDLNLFGRLLVVLFAIPGCIFVDIIWFIACLVTWHPLKKDAE
jgi:hypothetical protein